ncbi:hypothetical protein [Microbacterium sp. A94]|uniref:hypothetical protein n=1 Tax=Microbacterium sp. A94 TaxID=3450717 RepID=UPI003F41CD2E
MAGARLAGERGTRHTVVESEPTGGIGDGGGQSSAPVIVGDKSETDANGMPLENPSG